MSSKPAIRVSNLSKSYELGLSGRTESIASILSSRVRHPVRGSGRRRDRFSALDDVSFDIAPGEVVGVVGNNGAGKSTLLKILSRITPPSSGYIEIVGTVGSLLEVGTGFHPELTGLENVYLNGTILGMTRREVSRRLDEITAFAEIDRFLDTPVKRYSSGMRVRLAFAVAAHLDPEIMIIDEVLSVGDHAFQAKCLEKMRSVAADEGRTVLYVTHNLVTLENLCPRSLLLKSGQLEFDGPTSETLAKYMASMPLGQSGTSPGVYDLSAHPRGASTTDKVFTRLEIRPAGGAPSDVVRMGNALQLELEVQDLDEMPDSNVNITIVSESGQAVFRMTERMAPIRAAQGRHARERIVIEIASLPLTPGDYHLDIAVHDRREGQPIDQLNRAAKFLVVAGDLLGNGYQFRSQDGLVYIPWDWEVRPAAEVAPAPAQSTPGRAVRRA